jgi:predicted nucleic acid-binding protein
VESIELRYLADSVILIDHFNGIGPATDFLSAHASECALSVISRAETLAGFDDDGHALACELLDLFATLPMTADVADRAAVLRRRNRWKLPDAIQAAFAIEHELALVTRNTRDFGACTEPAVRIPYQL